MNTAQELNISYKTLTNIINLATATKENQEGERTLYFALARLPVEECAEVYAL